MNKAELVSSIAEKADMTKKDAANTLDITLETIKEALSNGDKVQLIGFGTFETRYRQPRRGRNPQTGEDMEIQGRNTPVFKPGSSLKDAVR